MRVDEVRANIGSFALISCSALVSEIDVVRSTTCFVSIFFSYLRRVCSGHVCLCLWIESLSASFISEVIRISRKVNKSQNRKSKLGEERSYKIFIRWKTSNWTNCRGSTTKISCIRMSLLGFKSKRVLLVLKIIVQYIFLYYINNKWKTFSIIHVENMIRHDLT